MEADQSAAPADAAVTPDAGAPVRSSSEAFDPFPWDEAFGQKTDAPKDAAAVQAADAPAGESAAAVEAPASKPGGDAPKDASDSGTPAAEPSKPDDGKPASADAPKPTEAGEPSRRQAARERDEAEKADLRRLVDEAIAERDRAVSEANEAKAAADRLDAERKAAMERRAELIGPEAEYQRRTRIANRMFDSNYSGPKITQDEADELARWTYTRELQEPFEIAARQDAAAFVDEQIGGQRATWTRQALAVADEIGLPRAELGKKENADLGVLLKVTAATIEARIREAEVKPLQETVSQLEATIQGLEAKVVHSARVPTQGGRSDGGLAPSNGAGWDPSLPWDANFGRVAAGAGSPGGR